MASIKIVTKRQARLVRGWVTVLEPVNHLTAEAGSQVYSAQVIHLWVGTVSIYKIWGSKQIHCEIH